MATTLSSRILLTVGALAALAGPAAAQPNIALGRPVTLVTGTVNGVGLGTLTDGTFQPDQTGWQTNSVWWNGTAPVLEIDLGAAYSITGLISQVDNNDTYRVTFRNPGTGIYGDAFDFSPPNSFGLRTWPNPGNNAEIGAVPPVLADRIRFEAISGDNSYSVSEIQLFGTTSAPEPATLALTGLGLAGVGLIARRRRA